MGTSISRHLKDLGELAGCEGVDDFSPAPMDPMPSSSRPSTPASFHKPRVLPLDPRSPSAEIVRTPIEVMPSPLTGGTPDSPMSSVLATRRSYLETDLDSLATQEHSCRPTSELPATPKPNLVLPAGLTHAHLLKLRFLGIDPRSPSTGITRTPIQVKSTPESERRATIPIYSQDDTLSIGSVSTHDMGNLSMYSSTSFCDFSRDCSDPSAFISEIEETDAEETPEAQQQEASKLTTDDRELSEAESVTSAEHVQRQETEPGMAIADSSCKTVSGKLEVFCEDDLDCSPIHEQKIPFKTPDCTSFTKRSRTPLTPLCNQNMTPNNIIRAKQSQSIQKENKLKVKIFNQDENTTTPSKQALTTRQLTSAKSTGVRNSPVKSGRKVSGLNSENAEPRRRALAQWDHDTTIII